MEILEDKVEEEVEKKSMRTFPRSGCIIRGNGFFLR